MAAFGTGALAGAKPDHMLRLLHVIPSIAPQSGGPAGAVVNYANLSTEFAEVTILTTNEDIKGMTESRLRSETGLSDNVNLVACDYLGRHSAKFSWPMLLWLNRHLLGFDVVHLHAAFSVMTTLTARKCRKFGVPYVFRPLGTLTSYSLAAGHSKLKQLYWWLLEANTVKYASRVHVTSPAEKAGVKKLASDVSVITIPIFIAQSAPQETLRNEQVQSSASRCGIDQTPGPSSDYTTFGFLSRIHPKKNVEGVFKALAALKTRNWQLEIAGSGEPGYVEKLNNLTKHLGIQDQVSWAGFVSGEAKTRFFQSIDFFLLPSFDENFGIAAGEALSHGIPSILSDQVDIGSWGSTETGVIKCRPDPDSIREAIETAVSWSPEFRRKRGEQARTMIAEHFNPETIKQQLRELYTDL